MKYPKSKGAGRQGAVAPFVALLLIPILAMLAYAVDTGYMVVAQTELQNAADAAALAGVDSLRAPYAQWATYGATSTQQSTALSTGQTNAKSAAKTYANYNRAGGVNITLQDGDITFGYTDSSGTYTSPTPSGKFPNTVQVVARRDKNANNPLSLFFASVIGTSQVSMTATARATMYTATYTSFDTTKADGLLLPVAVNVADWNAFFSSGAGTDVNNNSPNGLPQLNIYPGGGGQPGNNGLLSLMGSKAPSQQYYSGTTGWIQAGPSASDLQGLSSNNDIPLPTTADWGAGPGMKSSLLGDFQAMVGVPKILPLYDTSGGNGSNAWYHIVQFVGVDISYADGHGKANMTINVQPYPVADPNAIYSNPVPAGSTSTSSFTFIGSKLTY